MRGVLGLLVVAFVVLACAGVAGAGSTIRWQANFPEPFGGPNHTPFDCASGTSCGSGQVTGLGFAQDVVVFGACGQNCDVRTLTFADGSTLVLDENEGDFSIPGNTGNAPGQLSSYGDPITIELSDTIVGGTGRFAGASGSGSGHVKIAGGTAIITLSGTVTF